MRLSQSYAGEKGAGRQLPLRGGEHDYCLLPLVTRPSVSTNSSQGLTRVDELEGPTRLESDSSSTRPIHSHYDVSTGSDWRTQQSAISELPWISAHWHSAQPLR